MKKIVTNESYRNDLAKKLREFRGQGIVGQEIAETLLKEQSSTDRYTESKLDIDQLYTVFTNRASLGNFELLFKGHTINHVPFSPQEIETIQAVITDLMGRSGKPKSDAIEMISLIFDQLPLSFIKEVVVKLFTDIYEIHEMEPAYYVKGGRMVHPSYHQDCGKNLDVVGEKHVFRRGGMSDYSREYGLFSSEKSLISIINLILQKEEDREFMYDVFLRLAKFNININSITNPKIKELCLNKSAITEILNPERIKQADIQKGKVLLYMKKNGISFSNQEFSELLDTYQLQNDSSYKTDYWRRDSDGTHDNVFETNSDPLKGLIDYEAWQYIADQTINADEIDYKKISAIKKRIPLQKILSLYPKEKLTTNFINESKKSLSYGEEEFRYIATNINSNDGDILDIPVWNIVINNDTAEFVYNHIALTPGCLGEKKGAEMFKRLRKKGLDDKYDIININSLKELAGEDKEVFLEHIIDTISFEYLDQLIRFGKEYLDTNPKQKEKVLITLLSKVKTAEDYDKLIHYLSKDGEYYNLNFTKELGLGIATYYYLFGRLPKDIKGIPQSLYQQLMKEGKIDLNLHMPTILPDCIIPNFDTLMQLKQDKATSKN